MFVIPELSKQFDAAITNRINQKTKPLGALGQLETLAAQLAQIQSSKINELVTKLAISKPSLIVFAADHGIAKHGVSIAPSEVTQQMVMNFATGGAAVNVFCRQFGWQLDVVDAGMLAPVDDSFGIIEQRLGQGTEDFSEQPAMSMEQVQKGLELGSEVVKLKIQQGADLIAFGEMGIGNTSSASAIMSIILDIPAEKSVGAGTGIDETSLTKKQALIQQALDLHQVSIDEPLAILQAVGGFEITQICGGILAAAQQQVPVVIDGFICTAAAMIAKLINPSIQQYLIFAHSSDEQGHQKMLDWFDVNPLLQLGMRLGEGSGAALSLPIIQAAMSFYNDMASFEQANVEDVVN